MWTSTAPSSRSSSISRRETRATRIPSCAWTITSGGGRPRAFGEARQISVKNGDTIRPLLGARFGRSADGKALNNQIRNLFLETVLKICGVRTQEELPEAVRTAMKLKDYDNGGHPLTVRGLSAKICVRMPQLTTKEEFQKAFDSLADAFVEERNADEATAAARPTPP